MRQSTALLARRLLGAAPRLLAGSEAAGSVALFAPVAAAVPAAAFAARAFVHSAPFAAADAASTSASSSSSGPLNARTECGDVPEGHKESDLSHHVNNIGLGRRRDLTLRPDVRLHGPTGAGAGQQLSALLKVRMGGWNVGKGRAGDWPCPRAGWAAVQAVSRLLARATSGGTRKKKKLPPTPSTTHQPSLLAAALSPACASLSPHSLPLPVLRASGPSSLGCPTWATSAPTSTYPPFWSR